MSINMAPYDMQRRGDAKD